MTSHGDLYQHAEYYDIAFDFRDVAAECDFLTALCRIHGDGEPERFLELAAGPAQHAREMARRRVRATALDVEPRMLAYAAARAREAGTELECIRADMTAFDVEPKAFDLAALLMNSATYLLDNDMALRHLRCVAEHLAPGGLYVLEMSHPRDVFKVAASTRSEWTAERNGTTVTTEWGAPDDVFDPITQVCETTVTMHFDGPRGNGTIVTRGRERSFTVNELDALVLASGRFEIVDRFGAMQADVRFSNEKEAWRLVTVLRRTG